MSRVGEGPSSIIRAMVRGMTTAGWSPRSVRSAIKTRSAERTHPTRTALVDGEYLMKPVTLSLALRSSGDTGRGFGRG